MVLSDTIQVDGTVENGVPVNVAATAAPPEQERGLRMEIADKLDRASLAAASAPDPAVLAYAQIKPELRGMTSAEIAFLLSDDVVSKPASLEGAAPAPASVMAAAGKKPAPKAVMASAGKKPYLRAKPVAKKAPKAVEKAAEKAPLLDKAKGDSEDYEQELEDYEQYLEDLYEFGDYNEYSAEYDKYLEEFDEENIVFESKQENMESVYVSSSNYEDDDDDVVNVSAANLNPFPKPAAVSSSGPTPSVAAVSSNAVPAIPSNASALAAAILAATPEEAEAAFLEFYYENPAEVTADLNKLKNASANFPGFPPGEVPAAVTLLIAALYEILTVVADDGLTSAQKSKINNAFVKYYSATATATATATAPSGASKPDGLKLLGEVLSAAISAGFGGGATIAISNVAGFPNNRPYTLLGSGLGPAVGNILEIFTNGKLIDRALEHTGAGAAGAILASAADWVQSGSKSYDINAQLMNVGVSAAGAGVGVFLSQLARGEYGSVYYGSTSTQSRGEDVR